MVSKSDPAKLDSLQGLAQDGQANILAAVQKREEAVGKWLKSPYASKAEAAWADVANLIIYDELGERIIFSGFEWLSFNLPGGRYTPDFFHIAESGQFIIVEVKATKKQGSYRDSRAKLRAAAALNPWATFIMALKLPREDGWDIEIIEPKASIVDGMVRHGLKAYYGIGD